MSHHVIDLWTTYPLRRYRFTTLTALNITPAFTDSPRRPRNFVLTVALKLVHHRDDNLLELIGLHRLLQLQDDALLRQGFSRFK